MSLTLRLIENCYDGGLVLQTCLAPRHTHDNCNFITHSHLRAQMHATSFRLKQKQSRPAFVPFGLEAWPLRGGMWFQKSHVVAQKVCSNSDNGLRGVFSFTNPCFTLLFKFKGSKFGDLLIHAQHQPLWVTGRQVGQLK